MNADAFRYLYDYHFSENRNIWDLYVAGLTYEQFTQKVDYSYGSIRNQVIHLMEAENGWFCELRDVDMPEPFPSADFDDRSMLRAQWDTVEKNMRGYLAQLKDDMLFEKPIKNNEDDKDLILWKVLIHVVNHGTDHRAQILRILHDMGLKTGPQDYIFYVYDHM
jgi:uncharacterized damage-inducible protein DinB